MTSNKFNTWKTNPGSPYVCRKKKLPPHIANWTLTPDPAYTSLGSSWTVWAAGIDSDFDPAAYVTMEYECTGLYVEGPATSPNDGAPILLSIVEGGVSPHTLRVRWRYPSGATHEETSTLDLSPT